jgi:hypothetical protein
MAGGSRTGSGYAEGSRHGRVRTTRDALGLCADLAGAAGRPGEAARPARRAGGARRHAERAALDSVKKFSQRRGGHPAPQCPGKALAARTRASSRRTPPAGPGQHPEREPRHCPPLTCSKNMPLTGAGSMAGLRSAPANLTPSKSKGSEIGKHYSPTHHQPKTKSKPKVKIKVKVKTMRGCGSSRRRGLHRAAVQVQRKGAG